MIRLEQVLKHLCQMSWRCLEDVFARRLENVLARRLEDVLKTSSRCLEVVFARRLEHVLNTSSEDVWVRWIYLSWSRRPEDVFWRWRRKTFSRRLHQDECLLGPHIIWPREIGFDCITNCLTDNSRKSTYFSFQSSKVVLAFLS